MATAEKLTERLLLCRCCVRRPADPGDAMGLCPTCREDVLATLERTDECLSRA